MSEEMRKDTPEVGQWILLDGNSAHRFIRDDTGVWVLQHHTGMGGPYGVVAPRPWKPMTNPEENRLRARVRELEEAIQKHMESEPGHAADRKLYRLLGPTQEVRDE